MRAIIDIDYAKYLIMRANGEDVNYIRKYDENEKMELEKRLKDNYRIKELKQTIRECRAEIKEIELDEYDRLLFERESDPHSK